MSERFVGWAKAATMSTMGKMSAPPCPRGRASVEARGHGGSDTVHCMKTEAAFAHPTPLGRLRMTGLDQVERNER